MKDIIRSQKQLLVPDVQLIRELTQKVTEFKKELTNALKKNRVKADVVLGGSFAKGTLVKKELYDIDVLVRFSHPADISQTLERVLKFMKKKYMRVHGSRDYFQIRAAHNAVFEIIPVLHIPRPVKAENVTDLTYFHVSYVKKKIKGLEDEVRLAKRFCQAHGVYGAESYIQGFSGYALECLIIHYKSFVNFLKAVARSDTILLDPAHHYKTKDEILVSLNQSKLKSPIVLVDPTFKERNVLAALNVNSFQRFKEAAIAFLKRPTENAFLKKETSVEQLTNIAARNKAEFVRITVKTNRQAGDIAGTKLKKFHRFIEQEITRWFDVIHHEFHYDEEKLGTFYLIAKAKKKIIKQGPPKHMEKHAKAFKKAHKKTFEKDGILYTTLEPTESLAQMLKRYANDTEKLEEHAILSMLIESL